MLKKGHLMWFFTIISKTQTEKYRDEFVRHKILDLIGDLTLLGHPIVAKIRAYKTGHALNHKLMKRLWAKKTILGDNNP